MDNELGPPDASDHGVGDGEWGDPHHRVDMHAVVLPDPPDAKRRKWITISRTLILWITVSCLWALHQQSPKIYPRRLSNLDFAFMWGLLTIGLIYIIVREVGDLIDRARGIEHEPLRIVVPRVTTWTPPDGVPDHTPPSHQPPAPPPPPAAPPSPVLPSAQGAIVPTDLSDPLPAIADQPVHHDPWDTGAPVPHPATTPPPSPPPVPPMLRHVGSPPEPPTPPAPPSITVLLPALALLVAYVALAAWSSAEHSDSGFEFHLNNPVGLVVSLLVVGLWWTPIALGGRAFATLRELLGPTRAERRARRWWAPPKSTRHIRMGTALVIVIPAAVFVAAAFGWRVH